MNRISRREFLRGSAASIATLALAGAMGGVASADDTTITIWVADNMVDLTTEYATAYLEENYPDFTIDVQAVGEGDAASNMITDVEGGADIYTFAQDQKARLVSAGALSELSDYYAEWVAENNDAGSVAAVQNGEATYAFPITSDNGYFLYYDSSVVTDPTSVEAILADCEAAGKGFYFQISGGWYNVAMFFGTGCTLTYEADESGTYTNCTIDYASDAGVTAMKALISVASSSAFYDGSSIGDATNCAAIVDGTWDSTAAQELFGENYACTKLPTFTVDDVTYQMNSFGGYKMLGVKPQTDENKALACFDLAQYLADAEVQLARFEAEGWGPSNLTAQADEAVQENEALTALAEQSEFAIPQGDYPDDYWTVSEALGKDIIAGTYNDYTDEQLLEVLTDFQAQCEAAVTG
ncbi:MAG: substrate-binding domain-containing protein [Lachnospiraceae bacterium]|nr:substrate-binding domain-containing protein [Lachnospiraceae bacterium]